MATYLDAILDTHRVAAAAETRALDDLLAAVDRLSPTRGFGAALAETDGLGVIAEVKRRSPSKGDLFADLDPAGIARSYRTAAPPACRCSPTTEYFGGSAADLAAARSAVSLPGTAQGLHGVARTTWSTPG